MCEGCRAEGLAKGAKGGNAPPTPAPAPAQSLKTPVPTAALPGTPEKVEVMRKRYANGEHLHHPKDAKR